ncbi:MAG: DnaA regulatory inactivator Hda [Pseudomonadota bacterium]|nr:DnaA regulatory inactivator Hda [Pseudomonadota bacterium]
MSAPGTRQLPLALRYPPDQRFETCVGIPAEVLAQLSALATTGGDGIYLAGAAGVGKTHLALAACAAAEAAGRRAAYLPLQAAAGRLRDALQAMDAAALVALDGIDAIAGNRDDEVALFDFHNRARGSGVSLLYAGRAAPDGLPLVLPDLRSRLSQCARVVLSPLDDEGRREVLRERARRRGLAVDPAALEWLLRRVGRDLGGLTRLLDRLDHASLAAQRRLTVPFLRETLGDL